MTDLDVPSILGPGGAVSRLHPAYEPRPQQLEMAHAVASSIDGGGHLVVEAGTGVGKSFAYLVPALLAAQATGTRIVVSTRTIALQEQLLTKDIPFLRRALPFEFNAELVKGRSNYLSLRRLGVAIGRLGAGLFDSHELDDLQRLTRWSLETKDGSRSDLSFTPAPNAWDAVESDSGNCLGRKCPRYRDCFYYHSVRRARTAHLIVVNHALYMTDLALRRAGASLLPDHDVAIFDEAHSLESVAADHLGLRLGNAAVAKVLNRLASPRGNRGLLAAIADNRPLEAVLEARIASDSFFPALARWRERDAPQNGRARAPVSIPTTLPSRLRDVATAARASAGSLDPTLAIELDSAALRCDQIAADLEGWLAQELPDCVYWVETRSGARPYVNLLCAPLDVGPILRDELFDRVRTCVLTSATLAVGSPASFTFFRRGVGLAQSRQLDLGSPFDYRSQAQIHLIRGLPDPSADSSGFERRAIDLLPSLLDSTGGHALVLFTSYRMLQRAAEATRPWFDARGLTLLVHGEDLPRGRLIEAFRDDPSSVLYGTDSFWEGVDVPGDALSHVIITRLPFRVPTDPVLEARKERVEARGGRWFDENSLPEAVLRLKQGFGRLIRSATDQGRVTILDPRVLTKSYGRRFLDSLPPCSRVVTDARDFPSL